MKRHPALQPLSHEHHRALLHWRQLDQQVAKSDDSALFQSIQELLVYGGSRFEPHMQQEETVVQGILSDSLQRRLETEHKELRSLFRYLRTVRQSESVLTIDSVDRKLIAEFATFLRAHIRWEERVLFPFIQDKLSDGELAVLASSMHSQNGQGPVDLPNRETPSVGD